MFCMCRWDLGLLVIISTVVTRVPAYFVLHCGGVQSSCFADNEPVPVRPGTAPTSRPRSKSNHNLFVSSFFFHDFFCRPKTKPLNVNINYQVLSKEYAR